LWTVTDEEVLRGDAGHLTAIGGFVDIGDIVANAETGARFGIFGLGGLALVIFVVALFGLHAPWSNSAGRRTRSARREVAWTDVRLEPA